MKTIPKTFSPLAYATVTTEVKAIDNTPAGTSSFDKLFILLIDNSKIQDLEGSAGLYNLLDTNATKSNYHNQ